MVFLYYQPRINLTKIKRKARTIPFGYKISDDTDFIESVDSELEALQEAKNYLATHSAKAATKMVDMLDEDGTTPHANIRLEAAKQILDRIGIAKKDQLDINMKALHGIFILPAKDTLKEPNDKEDLRKRTS